MTETENDKAYKEGFEAGKGGGFLEDIVHGAIPSFSRRGEVFEKGYQEGMRRRGEDYSGTDNEDSDRDNEECEEADDSEYDDEKSLERYRMIKRNFTSDVANTDEFRSFYKELAGDRLESSDSSVNSRVSEIRSLMNDYVVDYDGDYDPDVVAKRLAGIVETLYTKHFQAGHSESAEESQEYASRNEPIRVHRKTHRVEGSCGAGLGTILVGAVIASGLAYLISKALSK